MLDRIFEGERKLGKIINYILKSHHFIFKTSEEMTGFSNTITRFVIMQVIYACLIEPSFWNCVGIKLREVHLSDYK